MSQTWRWIGKGASQPPETQSLPNPEGCFGISPCFADIYRCKATENFNFFLQKNPKMFLALASTHKTRASSFNKRLLAVVSYSIPLSEVVRCGDIRSPHPAHILPTGTTYKARFVFKMKGSITILYEDVCFFSIFADDKNIEVYLLLLCTKTNWQSRI